MESLLHDSRLALRQLRQRPLFAAVAALSIAIGVGATTTIMSVANALLLTPPPGIDDPTRIVEISRTTGGRGRDTFAYPELLDMREQAGAVLEHVAGWQGTQFSYSTGGDGANVLGMVVSWNYFAVMGVEPERGRFFTADEDATPDARPVAVVSDHFWRTELAASPDVVGGTVTLNRRTFTVVGVAPPTFRGHLYGVHPAIYVPMMMMATVTPGFHDFDARRSSWLMAVGRLRPGATVDGATATVQTVFARMPQFSSDPRNARSAVVDPIGRIPAIARGPVQAFIGLLLALVVIILLVTCANVAGMLLARAAGRSKEIAIRLALGSGRARLVRQLTIEALVLFGIGGGAGVAAAMWGTALLATVPVPAPIPIVLDFAPNATVLVAGLCLALATGVLFGLAPALQSTRTDLAEAMKSHSQSIGRSHRMRRAFVMTQVGLSMILLLSAGLFLRSLQVASTVPIGFDPTGVRLAAFDLSINGYDAQRGSRFLGDVLARLRAQPGIAAAAATDELPLDLGIRESGTWVAGSPAGDEQGQISTAFFTVSDGYFEALALHQLDGRVFDARDVGDAPRVVVVSRRYAEAVWPGGTAIGQALRFDDSDSEPLTVIGVVDDVKNQSLMESVKPTIYLPLSQHYRPSLYVAARGAPGSDVSSVLRATLHDADPRLALAPIQSLASVTGAGILPQRIAASITTALGALALLLSALGVYGVMAFTVTQRTREIGVRMALGARGRDVVRLVLVGGLRLAVPGLIIGVLAGLALSKVLGAFILGVAPGDPATFLGVPALLLAAVVVACWVPSRRAAGVDPTVALRSE